MHRLHAIVISLLLAGAAVAGASAAFRTVRLGPTAAKPARVPDAVVAARRAKLDRWSAQLERARASRPPALPKLPRFAPVVVPTVPAQQVAVRSAPQQPSPAGEARPPQQGVTYVQPPPVVKVVHPPATAQTTAPAHESEHESEHESDDHGGGHDDGGEGD